MANYCDDLRQGDERVLKIDMSGLDEKGVRIAPTTDLTDYKFWFTLKKDILDLDVNAALQVSKVAGDSANDTPAEGIVFLTLSSSALANVLPGSYFYDLQMKRPGANGEGITTILPPIYDPIDPIIVYPQVTQAIA